MALPDAPLETPLDTSPDAAIDLTLPPTITHARLTCPPFKGTMSFHLPRRWAMHLYDYEATLWINGQPLAIRPGCVSLTPPGARVRYHWPRPSSHACAHFAVGWQPQPSSRVPLMQDLGEGFDAFRDRFALVPEVLPQTPWRAAARLCDLLGELAQPEPAHATPGDDQAVSQARAVIERQLREAPRIAELAQRVGLSHNQLIRRFRAELGMTPGAYLRQRRAEQARYLLTETTMPIQAVAAEVGVADLQQFNKLIRRVFGRSPTALRTEPPLA